MSCKSQFIPQLVVDAELSLNCWQMIEFLEVKVFSAGAKEDSHLPSNTLTALI
jgi:hypothetical protein